MTGDSDRSETLFTRRRYLGVLGATSAAVAAGATQVVGATGHGYGMSGYGVEPYGAGDGTVTEPTLEVRTLDAVDADTTSATLVGNLTELRNADTATVSFEWGPSSDGLLEQTPEQTVETTGEFEAMLADLETDTEYVFSAVATTGETVATGREVTLRTDQIDDGEPTEGTPQIEALTGVDVSNPNNPHVDAELSWEASIDASELYAAELVLSDHEGRIDSWRYDLSGDSATATERIRLPHRAGEQDVDYTVDLVVYSYYGNTDTGRTTFQAQ